MVAGFDTSYIDSLANNKTIDSAIEATEDLNSALSQYVISPVMNLGIAGINLDIYEEHSLEYSAEITDHYLENNSTVQDHISIKPLKIMLKGKVGELVYRNEEKESQLQNYAEKLTIINSYLPILTNGAKQLQSRVSSVNGSGTGTDFYKSLAQNSIGGGVDLYQMYKQLNTPKTKQAQVANFLTALFQSKQIISLETPWRFFPKMSIETLSISQTDTKSESYFSIVLKQINTIDIKKKKFNSNDTQGRLKNQSSEAVNKGKEVGKKVKDIDKSSIFSKGYEEVSKYIKNFKF
jgi:hypothetical protein